jgi:hypothetical protein
MPSVWEFEQIISKITNGISGVEQDIITKGFVESGLTPISVNTTYWCSSEYISYRAWFYNGLNGCLRGYGNKGNSSICRVVSALLLEP